MLPWSLEELFKNRPLLSIFHKNTNQIRESKRNAVKRFQKFKD